MRLKRCISGWVAFSATLVAGIILTVVTPIMGLWAERLGRLPLMWGSLLLLIVTISPAFKAMVNHTTPTTLILLVGWMALLKLLSFFHCAVSDGRYLPGDHTHPRHGDQL